MIDHHSALIYVMVVASAADDDMTDSELHIIGEIVSHLPVFKDFDTGRLPQITNECVELLSDAEGLDRTFEIVRGALPERLRETAYALACDIVAADGNATQEELRLLEMLRHTIGVGRLPAAAIERGAAARYRTL
ncbi:MAG: tellurite resistance TerB family protein [Alphaproteobacteria bacterium]